MSDHKNNWSGVGRLGANPEVVSDNVIRMRLAVDRALEDSENSENTTAWLGVTYFMNKDNPNSKFVKSQIDAGNLKKGSAIAVSGRLKVRNWKSDEKSGVEVRIIADTIDYYGFASTEPREGQSQERSAPKAAAAPDEF